jgi:hypothetical protein
MEFGGAALPLVKGGGKAPREAGARRGLSGAVVI